MHKIAESVSLLFNVDCEVKFEEGYPPTMNSPKLRASVEQAINAANLEVIDKPLPFLFGEDFSFYGQQLAPAYFAFVGTRNEDKGFVLDFIHLILILMKSIKSMWQIIMNNY